MPPPALNRLEDVAAGPFGDLTPQHMENQRQSVRFRTLFQINRLTLAEVAEVPLWGEKKLASAPFVC